MKRLSIFYILMLALAVPLCSISLADVVVLKNGQMIRDVKVTDLGDTILCESRNRTYYISQSSVESIIKTDRKETMSLVRGWADDLIVSMPSSARKYIHSYPRLIIAGVLLIGTILLSLAVVKFLTSHISLLSKQFNKKRQLRRDIKHLDENEKAVLREFIIQGDNTIELPVEDKTVAGLITKGILEKLGSKGEYSVRGLMLPLMITASAKKRMNPKMLGMPPALNDEARKALGESRPKFIADMAGFYKKLEKKSDIYW
jgi:hypothetical protein